MGIVMSVDGNEVLDRFRLVHEVNEVVGVWEICIEDCPVNPLKIKVVKMHHLDGILYMGIMNYQIQNPTQAGPYKSLHFLKTPQEALEDAIRGFLMFYKPELLEHTKFVKDKKF